MSRGGIGVGSASIILVFAVLCLTVFSLITFVVASNDKTLVEREAALVTSFFRGDALAESIVAEILSSDEMPSESHGIDIHSQWIWQTNAHIVTFSAPISDNLALLVRMAVHSDTYEIMVWRMYNSHEWQYDASLNVWPGSPGDAGGIDLGDIDPIFGLDNPWETTDTDNTDD